MEDNSPEQKPHAMLADSIVLAETEVEKYILFGMYIKLLDLENLNNYINKILKKTKPVKMAELYIDNLRLALDGKQAIPIESIVGALEASGVPEAFLSGIKSERKPIYYDKNVGITQLVNLLTVSGSIENALIALRPIAILKDIDL